MYDLNKLIKRIVDLADKQELSINIILKSAGLSKSVLDNMKRNQNPSIDKIYILADYFNVSIDYLTGRTDNPNSHKS